MKWAKLYWNLSAAFGVLIQVALFGVAAAGLAAGFLDVLNGLLLK